MLNSGTAGNAFKMFRFYF